MSSEQDASASQPPAGEGPETKASSKLAEVAEFIDDEGRVWRPQLNLWHVKRFQQETGVGLFATTAEAVAGVPTPTEDGQMQLSPADVETMVAKMCGGLDNMPTLLWLGCEEQAKARGVTEAEFGAAIRKSLGEAIIAAMLAVFELFPSTSKLSRLLQEVADEEGIADPFPTRAAGRGSKSTG